MSEIENWIMSGKANLDFKLSWRRTHNCISNVPGGCNSDWITNIPDAVRYSQVTNKRTMLREHKALRKYINMKYTETVFLMV